MTIETGYRYASPKQGQLGGDEIPVLRIYISGIQDDWHEIDLEELAEALKPHLFLKVQDD